MKFLHTADLHLDSAFCALGATAADKSREAQRKLLERIFELAKRECCDMLLIAGDMLDTVFVTPQTQALCLSLFADFKNPVLIAPGNHDPFVAGSFYKSAKLPENVFVFSSPELQFFDFPALDATVAGYAFTSSAMHVSPLAEPIPPRSENGRTLLLCAHAALDAPSSPYAPVLSETLARCGFTYAALGHVHNPSDTDGTVRYCGTPEGRGFDEQGDKSVIIVSVDGGQVTEIKKHTVSEVRYMSDEVFVGDVGEPSELFERLSRAAEKYRGGIPTHLRLELTGTLTFEPSDSLTRYKPALEEGLASLELIDSTLTLPDDAYLEKDVTLRGEFYRTLKPQLYSDVRTERERALRALRIGLAAIDGKSFTDGGKA